MGAFAHYITKPAFTNLMCSMSEWFKNGEAGSTICMMANDGKQSWELLRETPQLGMLFNEAMTSHCKQQMCDFAKSYPHMFDGLNSLLDVGGNKGTAVKIIAEAFLFLRCIALRIEVPRAASHHLHSCRRCFQLHRY